MKKLTTAALLGGFVALSFTSMNVAEAKAFKDVSITHPYYNMISEMEDEGIISGYEDGTFKPNEHINRQHAALLITNAVELPNNTPLKSFKDVPTNHAYYEAIQKLQTAGIIQPDAKGNFNPKQALTRGEMAKIIVTAYDLKVKGDYTFSDVKGTEYEEYVKALYTNGVTKGYEDGTFKPNAPLTRAHYTLFMYQASNLKLSGAIEEDEVVEPTTPSSNIEDYPNDYVIPSQITGNYYENVLIPNSTATTPEDKEKDMLNLEKEQKELASQYALEIKQTGKGFTPLSNDLPEIFGTIEEKTSSISEIIGKTSEQTMQLINYLYATGNVYKENTFYIYYNHRKNGVEYGIHD